MRKFRLREVKRLFEVTEAVNDGLSRNACSWVSTICRSAGITGDGGASGGQVRTSDCTVKVRTAVRCCSPQNASTLWVGCDLAFRCWQAKFLSGQGELLEQRNMTTGVTGRRLQEQGVITEHTCECWGPKWADTNVCVGYVSSPLLMLLQKNIESKFLSWRRLNWSSRPATSASPGSTSEMQILRPHTRPVESDSRAGGASNFGFQKTLQRILMPAKVPKPWVN